MSTAAPDGKPVALVVMYLVPDNQRNHYLREVSMLAKAIETYPGFEKLREAETWTMSATTCST